MQARAMQTAIVAGNFGYWMDTLFTPNPGPHVDFPDTVIEETRAFFTSVRRRTWCASRHPHRRPALRHSSDHGFLAHPVVRRSRRSFARRCSLTIFLARCTNPAAQIDADWTTMRQDAAWVGKAGDPHQTLLNLLALHPSSVEYYSRNAESLAQLFNMLNRSRSARRGSRRFSTSVCRRRR